MAAPLRSRFHRVTFQRLNYLWKNRNAWSQIACFSEKGDNEGTPPTTDSNSTVAVDTKDSSTLGDHDQVEASGTAVNMSALSDQNLKSDIDKSENVRLSPVIKAMEKFEMILKERAMESVESENTQSNEKKNESFHQLLRKSKLMQIGDPDKVAFKGTIVRIIDNDMYIDFGGKFNCVCKKPTTAYEIYYKVGATVRLQVKDFEMTSSFLGSANHLTLEEADAVLLGLFNPPKRPKDDLIEFQ